MSELDRALAGIEPQATGEGDTPDVPGTAATDTPPPAAGESADPTVGEEDRSGEDGAGAPPPEGDQPTDKTPEQVLEEMRAAAEPQATDTPVIKQLRDLLRNRVDRAEPSDQSQALSDEDRETLEMAKGLFGYDVENNRPTTQGFVTKLAQRDPGLVTQVLMDSLSVPMSHPEYQNWTHGHQLLQDIGLDPLKFEDLKRFSRGEISGEQYGIDHLPEHVPQEYADAYRALNPVTRQDVDLYLRSESQDQKAAGLALLQDKNRVLEATQRESMMRQHQEQQFNHEVSQEVDTQLMTTYGGLLDAVGQSPAFVNVKVHADPNVDQMVKSTIVNQIVALADENAVLAHRAADSFKQMGVEIETDKVNRLLSSIRTDTEIAVRAQRQAKAQGREVSPQAQEALARRSRTVGEAIALANKYASAALAKYSPPAPKKPGDGGEPRLRGGDASRGDARPTGVMKPQDLDAFIQNVAKTVREDAAQ